ncbi:sulfotransferase [Sphingorhabdus sp. SMR4y]|uniref:sulfotransferase n=1 Tax=Sphingorhabdus sp. SMR4y TaxID=2584094 RepID=UPI000B5FFB65|nr:sulfotransferase [Sphingorhabdus sp. SMR4y]ASK88438.1 sulfotransferase family protein [Sphingorhabdus sp. SMR4y]
MTNVQDQTSGVLRRSGRFFGAQNDLPNRVKTHLFILCPNNSGSTYLERVIAECEQVWSLQREGQHIFGFSGPTSRKTNTSLAWNAKPETAELFSDAANYPSWESTKKAWYFQATAKSPNAVVFLTKSPPFLLIPQILQDNFDNTKFIFMVRNPYAVAEGIGRRRPEMAPDRQSCLKLAADHIVACMKSQRDNIRRYPDNSIFFRYEDMCQSPEETADNIRTLIPELSDLAFDDIITVKNYRQHLHNFNDEQIARLSDSDIACLNQTFQREKSVFEHFGYEIIAS